MRTCSVGPGNYLYLLEFLYTLCVAVHVIADTIEHGANVIYKTRATTQCHRDMVLGGSNMRELGVYGFGYYNKARRARDRSRYGVCALCMVL